MNEIIELLRCAAFNCDNIPKLGIEFAKFVKVQIEEAIIRLEKLEGDEE